MPTLPLTPPAGATTTTFQVGTYNSVSDTFTVVYDLNDYVNTWLHNAKTRIQPGKKVAVRSSNMRVNGERVVRWRRTNTHVTVECYVRDATPQAVVNRVHALIQAVDSAPYVIRFAEPGATSYSYFDVVLCDHSAPYDPQTLNANAITHISLDFEIKPEYRGDRITLQNLVVNPGFEAPSGPGVMAFGDNFANANAYTLSSGSAPSVASNVLSVPSGTLLTFGSPAWGAIQNWQIRWQWVTGLQATFFLHHVDNNNFLQVFTQGTEFELDQFVGGVDHQLQLVNATLTNGNWYWFKITQFPAAPGCPPYITVSLYNDSAGAIGTQVATSIGAATFDAVTALSGVAGMLASGATLNVGGNFSNVHTLSLFGPGGWAGTDFLGNSSYSPNAYAWDGGSNTYPNGPVTSFGCARVDFPPAGLVNATWFVLGNTQTYVPVAAPGNVLSLSAWVKASGVSASCTQTIFVNEYNASGTFLRQNTVVSRTGTTPGGAWVQLSGTYTTGASCAYVQLGLGAYDVSVAGASANGTVWWDNVQCWNQTTTGQSTMPYCELRFTQSPAHLLVSGIQGDTMARAVVECGLYCSSFPQGNNIALYLGRRGFSTANALLCSPGWTYQPPFTTSVLDSNSYGGFYLTTSIGNSDIQNISTQPRGTGIPTPADSAGIYHVFSRLWTADATPTSVWVSAYCDVELGSQMASLSRTDLISRGQNQRQYPFSAGSTWTIVDAGQVFVPPSPLTALTDPTKTYVRPFTGATGSSGTRYTFQSSFNALMPVDGELYIAKIINPAGANYAVTSQWLYVYADVSRGSAATFSVEPTPLANPARAGGSAGTPSSVVLNVNPVGDLGINLDPTGGASRIDGNTHGLAGVNQFCLIAADNNAALLPCAVDIVYSPVFLFPR